MDKEQTKETPPPRYDEAFKAVTVWMATEQGREPKEFARIRIDTLHNWPNGAGMQLGQASRYNREQQCIREWEAKICILCKQLGEKEEINDILKIETIPNFV